MILVDSCVLIAAFKQWEVHENHAINLLKSGKRIWVMDYVISETMTVIQMRESHDAMKKCIQYITIHPYIEIIKTSPMIYNHSLQSMVSHVSKLSFVDWLLVTNNALEWYDVITYDKQILKYLKK